VGVWLFAVVVVLVVVVGLVVVWSRREVGRNRRMSAVEQEWLDENDPLARAVNRAFNTGEPVLWHEGDPLPEPGGPVRRVGRDAVD
jgi:hypothetical protein